MKLHHKLILILCAFVIVPLIVVGYYFTQDTYRMMLDHTIKTTRVSGLQVAENLKERLLTYIQMSNLIITHKELRLFLESPPRDWQAQIEGYQSLIANEIGRYSLVNPYLKATVFVENDDLLLDHTHIAYADETVRATEWYKAVRNSDRKFVWQGLVDKSTGAGFQRNLFFSFARPLVVNGVSVGVLLIEVNEIHLYSLISEESDEKIAFIVNPGGEIVSSNRRDLLGLPIGVVLDPALTARAELYGEAEFDNGRSLLFAERVHSTSAPLDWKVYTVIPDTYLLQEALQKRNLGAAVTLTCVLWSIGAVFLATWHPSRRLKALASKMNAIRHGKFGDVVTVKGKDEIAELGHTFNLMSVRLREFVVEGYENEIKRKDLELKQKQTELQALQSRINPHFLFNTLDAIRTGALRSRDNETVEKIELLAQLFRQTISWKDDFIPLETELGFVKDYIALQKIRFKEKFVCIMDIDPRAMGCKIPKFIIQPLIENAFIHGIEKSDKTCELRVIVQADDGVLHMAVEDTGAGFAPGKLETLERMLREEDAGDSSHRIGLRNVHDRIALLYGKEYGLALEALRPTGVRVIVRLPWPSGETDPIHFAG